MSAETLSDLQTKFESLERANFDLKMQVFYLNKKISDGVAVNDEVDQSNINVNLIEDRSTDILALREELDFSKRRTEELESELFQLQLLRDNEALEYQKMLQSQPSVDITILEESRRREREVAKTVAEHDAQLIAKLRNEIDSLEKQHDRDAKLVEDCTARLTSQMELAEETNIEIKNLRDENNELQNRISVLMETAKQQEQQLTQNNTTEELNKENIQLKEQIERQRISIANQTAALNKLGTESATESEEIIRMSSELEACYIAKDNAIQQQERLKYENDVLRVQIYELKSINSISQEPSPLNRSNLLDIKVAETYKKREAELLSALEGVIQRCKELESAHYLHNHQHEQLSRSSHNFHDYDATIIRQKHSEHSYQNVSRSDAHLSTNITPTAGINNGNINIYTDNHTQVLTRGDGGEQRGRQMQRGSSSGGLQRQHIGSSSIGNEVRSRSTSRRAWH